MKENIQFSQLRSDNTDIPALTSWRGIAAVWVLFFHLDVAIFYRDMGALIPHDASGILQKGYLWVDFFFILSGFIMAHAYGQQYWRFNTGVRALSQRFAQFMWARFSRIYPLHLFTLGVVIIATALASRIDPSLVDGSWRTYFDWQAIPSHLMLTNAMNQHTYLSWNIASWSIGAEWWTYLLIMPALLIIERKLPILMMPLSVGALACLYVLMKDYGNGKLDITSNYGFFRCVFEFTIGFTIYGIYRHTANLRTVNTDALIIGIVVGIVACFHWELNDLIIIPLFSLLIFFTSHNQSATNAILTHPIFVHLGKISYSIYLVHSLWFLVFWYTLPRLEIPLIDGHLSGQAKIIYIVSFVALTLAVSHWSYKYVEVACRKKLRALVK